MLRLSTIVYLLAVMLSCMLLSYASFEQIFDAPTLAYATAYALIFSISMLGATSCITAILLIYKRFGFECSEITDDNAQAPASE